MIYRPLGASGLAVSEVGLGCEHLQDKPLAVIQSVLDEAFEQGINILDLFMSQPQVRMDIGQALHGRRERMQIQGHIGAGWVDGQYCRVREPESTGASLRTSCPTCATTTWTSACCTSWTPKPTWTWSFQAACWTTRSG